VSDHIGSAVASLALDDDAFIATFEQGGFGGDPFPHEAHLRMAWLYVTRFGAAAAVDRAAEGIRVQAKSKGQASLYHDTMTHAWVYLVAEAGARSPSVGFTEFLTRNPQLRDRTLLLEYYSPDVLSSAEARMGWIASDLAPIPGAPESSVALGDAGAMASVATADYLFQYRQWFERHKMSLRELKEEFRQTDGDPVVKGKLRQLRMARMRKRMMSAVPKASVVITNPTHFAVALKYERGMNAPVCVAKGVDLIARKIREVAEANDVPVVENPPLARALHGTVEIDQEIPPEHYRAVAEIIGYIMRLRGLVSRPRSL